MVWAASSLFYVTLVAVLLLTQCVAAKKPRGNGGVKRTFAEESIMAAEDFCDKRRDAFVVHYMEVMGNRSANAITEFDDTWVIDFNVSTISRWAPCGTTGRNTLYEVVAILCGPLYNYMVSCDPSTAERVPIHFGDPATAWEALSYRVSFKARLPEDTAVCSCPAPITVPPPPPPLITQT